ncbi:MAG: arsenate reductase (glutaredoxin) [Saprospiraceae bacterium]|nr:arsenate reductase (glutaredoxin) [Saprospiraceae bacterium]
MENDVKIWHNPRCGTSRLVLNTLIENGIEPRVFLYLKTPPTTKALKRVLNLLKIPAEALVRKKEPLYEESFADAEKSEEEWIEILHKNPQIIERPIVIKGRKAVLARPPEKIWKWLKIRPSNEGDQCEIT